MNFAEGEILLFDKPREWTSFDVVAYVRGIVSRLTGIKKIKVGHAGTLDPLATGLLIVCTGKSTKTIDTLQAKTKEYIATLKLGATTPSFDMETPEDNTYPTEHITREMVESVLKNFTGTIEQIPPAYSALRIDGKRAYKLARKGKEVNLKAKTLVIDEIELLTCNLPNEISIRIVCSKGTYIRALARDIGTALGSGAYLTALRRTRIGEYSVEDSLQVSEFEKWAVSQYANREEETKEE